MPACQIKVSSVAEMESAPNLGVLFAEYTRESAVPGLGNHNVQFEAYRAMEAAGILHMLAAFKGPNLVGFIVMILTVLPHFGKMAATTESFFVASEARGGGTGLKLLRLAEDHARTLGASAFFATAPVGGRLDAVLPRQGYSEASRVFFKDLQP